MTRKKVYLIILAALLVSPEKAQAVKAAIQHPDCAN